MTQTPCPGGCGRRPRGFVLFPLRTIPNLGLQDEGRFPPRAPHPRCRFPPLPAALPAPSPGQSPQRGRGGGTGRTLQGPGDAVTHGGARATRRAAQDRLPPQPEWLFILKIPLFFLFFCFIFRFCFVFGIYLS